MKECSGRFVPANAKVTQGLFVSTTLIASDGYEYEDLTQRLLGDWAPTRRNHEVCALRTAGYEEAEVKAFYEAYDRARGPHSDKYNAGWRALDVKRRTHDPSR